MKIEKKIVSYKVKSNELAVVQEVQKVLDRPEQITGKTYKIKPVGMDCAMYITINDITVNGVTRPYEIFINTKHSESFQWVMIFTRLVSAVLRNGGEYQFVIDEMKEVFSPNGGYFVKGEGFVPSVVAHIGSVINTHMRG